MYNLELNRTSYNFENLSEIEDYLYAKYPEAVMYADDGERLVREQQVEEATSDGRRVLIWRNEAESENDDGQRAIGELTRE
jgi:hypothetical protein